LHVFFFFKAASRSFKVTDRHVVSISRRCDRGAVSLQRQTESSSSAETLGHMAPLSECEH